MLRGATRRRTRGRGGARCGAGAVGSVGPRDSPRHRSSTREGGASTGPPAVLTKKGGNQRNRAGSSPPARMIVFASFGVTGWIERRLPRRRSASSSSPFISRIASIVTGSSKWVR
jgi:hypothetical protein